MSIKRQYIWTGSLMIEIETEHTIRCDTHWTKTI